MGILIMCNLNTAIRVDAKRYKITNEQLNELHDVYHIENCYNKLSNLADLLDLLI
jgi:hypothetical protein